jgi:hypothetical protein
MMKWMSLRKKRISPALQTFHDVHMASSCVTFGSCECLVQSWAQLITLTVLGFVLVKAPAYAVCNMRVQLKFEERF